MPRTGNYKEGDTVDLTGMRAEDLEQKHIVLDGKYELVEFHAVEPSAYVWSDCWDIIPAGIDTDADGWDSELLFVDAYDLWAHLDPEGYKKANQEIEDSFYERLTEDDGS